MLACLSGPVQAQHAQTDAPTSPLTIERIMADPDSTVGNWPENVRWHENGQVI